MEYILRPYQREAVDKAVEFLKDDKKKYNAIEILPTGSGKSLILSNIAKELNEPTLIFQPSKEILEQNYDKFTSYGYEAGIYSASFNKKEINPVTFATIGSVKNHPELFKEFKYILVDECFIEGTLVDNKPIETIKKGDYVNSFNHETKKIELKKVTRIYKRQLSVKEYLIRVSFNEKNDIDHRVSFVCTSKHPIYTKEYGYTSSKLISFYRKKKVPVTGYIKITDENKSQYENKWFKHVKKKYAKTYIPESEKIREIRISKTESFKNKNKYTLSNTGIDTTYVYNLEVEDNNNYFAENILVHNCHFVNPKQGMYSDFLKTLGDIKTCGVSASPYRLCTDGFGGSILKFLTRTRPRVFKEVIYYIQNKELFDQGYLCPLKYYEIEGFDRRHLKLNSTQADFSDASVREYYQQIGFYNNLVRVVKRLIEINRKNILVFTRFVEESEFLVASIPNSAIVTAQSTKKEREFIINGFKSGDIKVVCNVGILTTGFDYPELETVVIASPTMSLARYYQKSGRVIRPHANKEYGMIVDMCENYKIFGKLEDIWINENKGQWFISSNGRQLTNVYFSAPTDTKKELQLFEDVNKNISYKSKYNNYNNKNNYWKK